MRDRTYRYELHAARLFELADRNAGTETSAKHELWSTANKIALEDPAEYILIENNLDPRLNLRGDTDIKELSADMVGNAVRLVRLYEFLGAYELGYKYRFLVYGSTLDTEPFEVTMQDVELVDFDEETQVGTVREYRIARMKLAGRKTPRCTIYARKSGEYKFSTRAESILWIKFSG